MIWKIFVKGPIINDLVKESTVLVIESTCD